MKIPAHIWEQHVAAARQEKESTRAYARKHGLALSTLSYWQRKLQGATAMPANDTVRKIRAANHSSKFVALRVAQGADELAHLGRPSNCTLVVGGGMRLEMSGLPDPQWLAALGRAAQAAC